MTPATHARGSSRSGGTELWMLFALGAALVSAQAGFPLLEDEVLILRQAELGVAHLLGSFAGGGGLHVHPPLSDILLSLYLTLSGHDFHLLRLPNIAAFILGAYLTARTVALTTHDEMAARAVLAFALIWPYGYQQAWMFGWFSIAFALVAATTFCWIRYRDSPSVGRLVALTACSVALVWTNYFGWGVVGLLALDGLIRKQGDRINPRALLGWLGTVAIAFLPLWPALLTAFDERVGDDARGLFGRLAYGAWVIAATFVGESTAPWALPWSVLVFGGLALSLAMLTWASRTAAMRPALGFVVAMGVLAVLGQIGAKRALFLTPWLLLGLGMAWHHTSSSHRRLVGWAGGIALAAAWWGTLSRDHFASLRLLEPWHVIAGIARAEADAGGTILAYHPTLFYYLERPEAIGLVGPPVDPARLIDIGAMNPPALSPTGTYLLVHSAGFIERQRRATSLLEVALAPCVAGDASEFLRDPAAELKQRLGEDGGHRAARITVVRLSCPVDSATASQ